MIEIKVSQAPMRTSIVLDARLHAPDPFTRRIESEFQEYDAAGHFTAETSVGVLEAQPQSWIMHWMDFFVKTDLFWYLAYYALFICICHLDLINRPFRQRHLKIKYRLNGTPRIHSDQVDRYQKITGTKGHCTALNSMNVNLGSDDPRKAWNITVTFCCENSSKTFDKASISSLK